MDHEAMKPGKERDERLAALLRSLDIAGSKRRLCEALWIGEGEFDDYLVGRRAISDAVYLTALDLIAGRRTFSAA